MNRPLIIIAAAVVIIATVVSVIFFLRSTQPAPVGVDTTPLGGTLPVIVPPAQMQTKAAVQAAYQKAIASDNPDHIKPYDTAIAGGYALQLWVGDVMGGEALLKYDPNKGGWVLVSGGGGAWSIEGLVQQGVPRKTAIMLLSDMPH